MLSSTRSSPSCFLAIADRSPGDYDVEEVVCPQSRSERQRYASDGIMLTSAELAGLESPGGRPYLAARMRSALNAPAPVGMGFRPIPQAQERAPAQLEPAPAVQPKQCEAVATGCPSSSRRSLTSQMVFALPGTSSSSAWLKSQS